MRVLIAMSSKRRMRVIRHGCKDKLDFSLTLIGLLRVVLEILSKDDILRCLDVAESTSRKDKKG